MTQSMWIVDAFTNQPFRGNPAGICLLDRFPDDGTMQLIAAQMHLPETAFLVKNAPLDYNLRWFSPETEVSLCGHATLAATHVLQQSGAIATGDTVTYHTQSGELRARALGKNIELDFPLLPGKPAKPTQALKALGVDILDCQRNRENYLIEVKDYKTLIGCRPDFKKLAKADAQGVIITTATGAVGYDFVSRYFAPAIGVDEDPVTGSAHCFLAPYWEPRLGKKSFHALQASQGQGILDVAIHGNRVLISGQAVTTLKGELQIPAMTRNSAA